MKKSTRISIASAIVLLVFITGLTAMAGDNGSPAEDKNQRLFRAVDSGVLRAVEASIKEGADVEARDAQSGLTPLIEASLRGYAEIM